MNDDVDATAGTDERPSAEKLLPEVYGRLSRTGAPTPARVWEALRTRFAQDWTAYCRARAIDEPPEWEDFPISGPGDVARLLKTLQLSDADQSGETQQRAEQGRLSRVRHGRAEGVTDRSAQDRPESTARETAVSGAMSARGRAVARGHMTRLPFDESEHEAATADGSQDAGQECRTYPGRVRARRTKVMVTPAAARQLGLFDDS